MNISPDGVTVRFKTEPESLFEVEKSGAKPNTVRILDDQYEYQQLKKGNPKRIIIQHQQEIFLRAITNIHVTENVFGKVIVIFSWARLETHQQIDEEQPLDVQAINVSLSLIEKLDACRGSETYDGLISGLIKAEPPIDETFVTVTISKLTQKLLHSIAHGRSINTVIRELYQIYINKLAEEGAALRPQIQTVGVEDEC